jgi:F-type H+-transporting ATPase subunit a
LFSGLIPVTAQNDGEHNGHPSGDIHSEEEFDAGKFVIEHVLDAYDWHIASFGDKHRVISIPLPVILYSKNPELHGGQKLHIFMSI